MSASPDQARIDDLFDYDVGLEDIFEGTTNTETTNKPQGDSTGLGLGLDEEVKVTKKRQPIAKLDDNRLLSDAGIPKLRQSAKKKLRFKGKGHEFSDAARLLNFYQLWLDNLFPRAKFADGLSMIEKLGHSKRIQTMRREWIDEEKPRLYTEESVDLPTRLTSDQNGTGAGAGAGGQQSEGHNEGQGTEEADADQLFISDPEAETRQPTTSHPEPDDDDLEDLLREQDEMDMSGVQEMQTQKPAPASTMQKDDFDDEYEAMNELGM